MKPKTKLYRITNKAKHGLWLFALDEQDAIQQAISRGHIKSPDGATKIDDQTQSRLASDQQEGLTDTQEIIDAGLRGPAARIIPSIAGADFISALKAGTKPQAQGRPSWTRNQLV